MSLTPVIVIALDGVPFSLLRYYFERGKMSCIKQLADRGAFKEIVSVQPPLSAPAWASFLTGVAPHEHGILSFTERDARSLNWYTPNAAHLRQPTLLQKLSDKGRRVFSMNIPVTYPPVEINGISICGFLGPDLERGVYPTSEISFLKNKAYRIDSDVNLAKTDMAAFLEDLHVVLDRRVDTARYYALRERWDLFMVHIMETDRLHHFTFESFHRGDPDMLHFYDALYGKIDRFVGWMIDHHPPDSRFVLLSDHGFTVLKREIYLNHWLWQQGYLRFTHPSPANLHHIHPDSRAYSLYPGRIFINLRGREKNGRVTLEAYDSLRRELTERLLALRDPIDGAPVIKRVLRGEDVYAPHIPAKAHNPHYVSYPDLLALPYNGYDLKGVLWYRELSAKTVYTGMHSFDDAFLISNDKSLAERSTSITDVGREVAALFA
ncbi:MAG TPA: hypothetical protein ENJ15_05805 [Caldithrix abyssi]|uniref:Phosphodiesterase n=1 Tax=Caldithrix abyssi TaxID=187145 RepID=A0A7V5RPS4_CALAY|nr:hypothetical protein [Caldithrix abyssi]